MATDAVITALQHAVAADATNVDVRLHLVGLLEQAGRADEALGELRGGVALDPGDARLLAAAQRVAAALGFGDEAAGYGVAAAAQMPSAQKSAAIAEPEPTAARDAGQDAGATPWSQTGYRIPDPELSEARLSYIFSGKQMQFEDADDPDVAGAEEITGQQDAPTNDAGPQPTSTNDVATDHAPTADTQPVHDVVQQPAAPEPQREAVPDSVDDLVELWGASEPAEPGVGELSTSDITLNDVGGMEDVKHRLNVSFLAPMRNPEMREMFGKSMRGGLLLWGPPGCGKTFVARAVAGELGASFYHVGLSDVLDMWIGSSERNVSQIFQTARANTPCVLFLDEVDAIGHKRSGLRSSGSAMRGVVNQLLQEMDGAVEDNEGVFVLAATNHPWDLDSALVRPGRLDRKLLVLPPDLAARQAILELHFRGKPALGLDLSWGAQATSGLTGADLSLVCEQATEYAMIDSIESGVVRPIDMADLQRAIEQIRPSHGPWLESAKNYALFANESGEYDELVEYLKNTAR